jgi:lipoprotein-anchoring transpeptidase ErfK/SrfK
MHRFSPSLFSSLDSVAVLALGVVALLSGCATPEPDVSFGPFAGDRAVQTQIFLDAQNFGPGVVDGDSGEFTSKALALYNRSQGLPETSKPDVSLITPYTTYTITAEDIKKIGVMAVEVADLAKQKSLPYSSLSELVSERYHTTQAFLATLNHGVQIDSLPVGSVVKVPNVRNPFRVDQFPGSYSAASAPEAAGRTVLVDTRLRMLEVAENGRTIAAFPITPGSDEHPAPAGEWKIAGAVPWPWYRYDEGVLKRGERTADFYMLPPGPNSPVGILWAGLNRPGVGIHGTTSPETIGRSGSHGCIRLSNWDAAKFYTMVRKGTPVTIR